MSSNANYATLLTQTQVVTVKNVLFLHIDQKIHGNE